MSVDRIQQCVPGAAASTPLTPPSLPVVGTPPASRARQTTWFGYVFGAPKSFAFGDGHGALKRLGGRVEERPGLMVRILLNVRLGTGDRTYPGDLLWRLADDFRESARLGSNRPAATTLVHWTWTARMQ